MIKKIMIENFLSIGEETFLFEPNSNLNIIYGENGAGKTNFMTALAMLKKFIVEGIVIDKMQNKFIEKKATKLFVEAKIDEKNEFQYFLQYDINAKHEIKIDQEIVVFNGVELINREENKYNLTEIEEQMVKKDKNFWEKSILNKIVTEIDNENKMYAEQLELIYNWFKEQLIFFPGIPRNFENTLGHLLNEHKEVKPELLDLIAQMNLPIFDILIEEDDRDIRKLIEDGEMSEDQKEAFLLLLKETLNKGKRSYKVSLVHSKDAKISYGMESSGTQKIISNLLTIAIASKKKRKMIYLSDEFDNSLHYELSLFLLKVMSKNEDIQFIGTTHNLIFLEQQEFGKKAFSFIEKDENECTTIFSLNDIKDIRTDSRHNWRKLYQDSRFGAYPQLNFKKGE